MATDLVAYAILALPLEANRRLAGQAHRRNHGLMPINADWHGKHPMPKNPTVEQRITWHIAHQEHCACRPIPEKLKELVAERRPTRKARKD